MADQRITLKIAGNEYSLVASTPEMEQLMRLAAESINQRLDAYNTKYATQTLEAKLVFVALMEAMDKLTMKKKMMKLADEMNKFKTETDSYLENIEK